MAKPEGHDDIARVKPLIAVSLTTTLQRLNLCRIALTSLVMQSHPPDQIILWVSSDGYLRDEGIQDPDSIQDAFLGLTPAQRALTQVRWVGNTGPYRKLIPALRSFSEEDLIVTADDDIYYGRDWLKKLLAAREHEPDNNTVVACRVRETTYNFLGIKKSYLHWKLHKSPGLLDTDYVITFGGGAVLSRALFHDEDILDDAFLQVAPTADDLWYSKLLIRNGIKVRIVPEALEELNFIAHTGGLTRHNRHEVFSLPSRLKTKMWNFVGGNAGLSVCANDVAYKNIESYFNATSQYPEKKAS